MEQKIKYAERRGMVKGIALVLLVIWLIMGAKFLGKVLGPIGNLCVLKDNYQYAMESNPYNTEYRDEMYKLYNDYATSLVNSSDKQIANFFSQNILVKLLIVCVAILPYVVVIYCIYKKIQAIRLRRKVYHRSARA